MGLKRTETSKVRPGGLLHLRSSERDSPDYLPATRGFAGWTTTGPSADAGRPSGRISMTSLTRRSLLGSAAAVTASSLIAPAVQAAVPASGKQAPGYYRYKVGDFEVTAFNDGYVKVPKLESFVVNQPLEAIQKTIEEAFIPKDDVRVPFNPLLVNTGSKLVLFDTGFGDVGAPTQGSC